MGPGQSGGQAKMACGNLQLCSGLKNRIMGVIQAVRERRRERFNAEVKGEYR